jgi:DNA modification methylase
LFEIKDPTVYYKSSENMEELGDSSIQLIITSPPYGKIKDYGSEEQIGYYDSFEDYFSRLKKVWRECYRVLEPQCRMVINIGDQYLRTAKFGRYRILSIASKIIDDCSELGFDFLGDIIWQKISTTNTTGGCSLMGSIYYPRNGLLTFDYEHILIFKKHEGKAKKVTRERKELSKISLTEWKKWYVGHWRFTGIMQKEHIAMFPEELPYRIIRMFSFIGDIVLDPFLGSGTTLKVAKSLIRKGIGYEINEDFKNIINTKIKEGYAGYFNDYQYLIYKIFNKANIEGIDIKVDDQKQKGIMILKNNRDIEVIFDYLYIDEDIINNNFLSREIISKFEENTIQNYINDKEKWDHFSNYIIVFNSNGKNEEQIFSQLKNTLDSSKTTKSFKFISLKDVISDKFLLKLLFESK